MLLLMMMMVVDGRSTYSLVAASGKGRRRWRRSRWAPGKRGAGEDGPGPLG